MPAILNCSTCKQPSDKKCKNCDEPHCSLECHAAKYKKSNDVVSKSKTITAPPQIKAFPINRTVKITAVINHRLVFVRPAEDQDEKRFARLMCDTVNCASTAEFLTKVPNIGSLVLAKFDHYQRALVLKVIDDTRVVVAFIDFGNIEIRNYRELKIMSEDLTKVRRFATKIRLSKVENDLLNKKALEYLHSLMILDVELSIKVDPEKIDGVLTAELKSPEKWVNQLINSINIDNIIISDTRNGNNLVCIRKFWSIEIVF